MTDITPVTDDATSNGWFPIEHFKPEHFGGAEEFLVWIMSPEGSEFCCVAQWDETYNENGLVTREKGFTGEWRHIEHCADAEPVAFRPMPEGPDYDLLERIVQTHGKEAA